MIGLMKDKKVGKIITKFAVTALKPYFDCVQKDVYKNL